MRLTSYNEMLAEQERHRRVLERRRELNRHGRDAPVFTIERSAYDPPTYDEDRADNNVPKGNFIG